MHPPPLPAHTHTCTQTLALPPPLCLLYAQTAAALITPAGLMFSFHKAPSWYPMDLELIKYEEH